MVGIYARVSTARQEEKYSLPLQVKMGEQFAKSIGEGCVVYKEAESGASLIGRDQLKQLLNDIERKLIDKVWCVELTRISRDLEDSLFIRKFFIDHKCELYENGRKVELSNPESLLSYHVTSAVSEFERSRLIERVRRAKVVVVNSGKKTFGRLYGYKLNFRPDGSKSWVTVEDEAKLVRYAYRLWEEGVTFRGITVKLNDEGYRTREGSLWHSNQIGRLLKQVEYSGYTRNKAGELIKSAIYKPIVSMEQWKRVQIAQVKINPTRNYRTRFADHLCTGLIRCAECGVVFYASSKSTKKKAYRYYGHAGKTKCTQQPTLLHLDLIEKVFSYIYMDVFQREDELKKFLRMKEAEVEKEQSRISDTTERFENRLREQSTRRARLVSAVANGTLSEDDIRDQMEKIRSETDAIQKKLQEIRAAVSQKQMEYDRLLEELSENQIKEWKKADISQRRKLLQRLVKSASMVGETLRVLTVTEKQYAIKVRNTPKQLLSIIEASWKKVEKKA